MAKSLKGPVPRIYFATVEGEDQPRLVKSTDPRLVRRYVIESLPQPAVEVFIPTTEQAMDAALDGLAWVDITKTEPREPDLVDAVEQSPTAEQAEITAQPNQLVGDDLPVGADEARLAPGEWIDNDGEIRTAEDDDTPF